MNNKECQQGVTEFPWDMNFFCGALHQSDLNMLARCPRAFMFRYKLGLQVDIESRPGAAGLGRMFHKLVQYGPDGIEEAKVWMREQQKVLWELVEAGEDIDGSIAASVKTMTDNYNKALAVANMYWQKFPDPDYLETLATEVYVEGDVRIPVGLDSITVTIGGTIDKLVRDKRDGKLWVRDWKTSSRDIEYIMTGYQWSTQCRMYRLLAWLWATQNNIENPKPIGFIVDGVQMPTIKFCKKDKDFAAYIERCKQWYIDQNKTTFTSRAIRYEEPILNGPLVRLLTQGYHKQIDIKLVPGAYPKDITASYCTNYERQCIYYDLCNSNQHMWPDIIARKYKVVEPTDNVNEKTDV